MWRPLENWVSKTWFINQKNLKKPSSLKRSLTSPDQIRERERVKLDQREGDQIIPNQRERERKSQIRSERERKSSCGLGLAQPRSPGSRGLGFAAAWVGLIFSGFFSSSSVFFFFFSFWLWFLFCWCCCFVIYGLINRVSKTRFPCGRHVEKDITSDVIRPWKSSLKDSIYRLKLSLLDSSC